jgi:hypothetical protein
MSSSLTHKTAHVPTSTAIRAVSTVSGSVRVLYPKSRKSHEGYEGGRQPGQCEFGKYCCGGTCFRYCHRPATKYLDLHRPEEEVKAGRYAGIYFCDQHFEEEAGHFDYKREEFLLILRKYGEQTLALRGEA